MTKVRTFHTIQRPQFFIGREALLDKIKNALAQAASRPDRTTVIAVRAPGGLGKTRLLEEVLLRLGRKDIAHRLGLATYTTETWEFPNVQYVPSDILDFVLPELSVRPTLLQALRRSLIHDANMSFERYDYSLLQIRRGLQKRRGFSFFQKVYKEIETSFHQDIQDNIQSRRRPVWAWDTVERLALPLQSALWHELAEALGEPLLSWEEADLIAGPWFLDRLQKGLFQGAVFLLAGRMQEGQAFWEALEESHRKNQKAFDLIWIEPQPFSTQEVRIFLEHTANNIRQQPEWEERVGILDYLLDNKEYLDAFVQLTAGKPVFLAIFADVLVTAKEMPISLSDLAQQLRRPDAKPDWDASRQRLIQTFVEALLSEGRKGRSVESRILLALARSPRGLDVAQLAYLFDAEGRPVEEEKLHKITEELRRLTIVKVRPQPPGILPEESEAMHPAPTTDFIGARLMLQDEIYPLFARYILEIASEQVRREERKDRKAQYEMLLKYAEQRRRALKRRRAELFRHYIQSLQIPSPSQALRPRWEVRASIGEQWSWVEDRLRFWELEHLHYRMLLDPLKAWNAEYLDLAETRWYTGSLEGDVLLQSEILALIRQYPLLLRFTDLPEKDESSPYDFKRLCYAVRTEEVVRWVKRLILAQRFHEAIRLSERIEKAIQRLFEREQEGEKKKELEGWMHPLSWGERRVWHTYARILAGDKPQLEDLENILEFLEKLVQIRWDFLHRVDVPESLQKIQPNGENLVKRISGLQGHPAQGRARRVLAIGYNFLGYGYVTQGQFERGRWFYRKSLEHMHYVHFPAQEAATRNNMGRALASIGKEEEGRQLVYQALRLRESMAELVPYAYSLNTAALLNNNTGRILRALGEAARAAAIFQESGDYRGRGLALIQVATALRRLAKTADPGLLRTVVEDPEVLLELADQAIDEALEIFAFVHCRAKSETPFSELGIQGVCEPVRLVEAQLVKSEILQDKMNFANTFEGLRHLYQESRRMANQALKRCKQEKWDFLAFDALVNQVETHYWFAYHLRKLELSLSLPSDQVHRTRQEALSQGFEALGTIQGIPEEAMFQEGRYRLRLPKYIFKYAPYWQLLSKQHRFEAGLLMERLWDEIFEKVRIHDHYRYKLRPDWDKNYKITSKNIARHFVKAVLYGRLFAPQTRTIRMAYRFIGRYMDELEALEFDWRQGPEDDPAAAEAIRRLMNGFYEQIYNVWVDYHKSDPLGRFGLRERIQRSIIPLPHQLASLPRWLQEVYLLPLETNGPTSGGSTP